MDMPKANSYCLDDLSVGMEETLTKTFTQNDVEDFMDLTNDRNPIHWDKEYAKKTMFKGTIIHGHLTSSRFSTLEGMFLPGKGTFLKEDTVRYHVPVRVGDTLDYYLEIISIDHDKRDIELKGTARNFNNQLVLEYEVKIGFDRCQG